MSFTWSFHAVFILTISLFCWCRDLQGTSMESPWNLHGKLHQNYIRVQDGTEELSKKGNMLRLLLLEITSNLHQNSMESPWNLHESDHWNHQGNNVKKPTSKLHGNYINSYLDLPIRQKKSCGNNVTREAQTNHNFLIANWSQIDGYIDRKSIVKKNTNIFGPICPFWCRFLSRVSQYWCLFGARTEMNKIIENVLFSWVFLVWWFRFWGFQLSFF